MPIFFKGMAWLATWTIFSHIHFGARLKRIQARRTLNEAEI